eukprot:5898041-Prymnesium_polylepis.1
MRAAVDRECFGRAAGTDAEWVALVRGHRGAGICGRQAATHHACCLLVAALATSRPMRARARQPRLGSSTRRL